MDEIMTKAQFGTIRWLNRLKLTSIGPDDNTEGGDDAQEGDAHGVHAEGDPARRPLDEVVGLRVLVHEAVEFVALGGLTACRANARKAGQADGQVTQDWTAGWVEATKKARAFVSCLLMVNQYQCFIDAESSEQNWTYQQIRYA